MTDSNESSFEKVKLSLLKILLERTQIHRKTIPQEKLGLFRDNLNRIILRLIDKIDSDTLKNEDIRNGIRELSRISDVSIGASQKAINVYLKYYCIIGNKGDDLLQELDCPIDSSVQKHYNLTRITLKGLDEGDYIQMQNRLGQKCGMRVLADIEAYDKSHTN